MSKICTADLSKLPDPHDLHKLMQSLALLDAIVSPVWERRHYSFNSKWAEGEAIGSMRNGSGDELFVLFNTFGAFIKGFDHERWDRSISAAEVYGPVPSCFLGGTKEPAFSPNQVTFCYWRTFEDDRWHTASVRLRPGKGDGSEWMLSHLDGDPASYLSFAKSSYERELTASSVAAVYDHVPMSLALATSLAQGIDHQALTEELVEIGYPMGSR